MLGIFSQLQKPIFISLSPNTEKDDILLALKLLFQPWRWKKDQPENISQAGELEDKFKKYLEVHPVKSAEGGAAKPQSNRVKYAIAFNSGRSALLGILKSLDLKEGDEVLLQAFTCNAAVNPILQMKAKPVFVDITDKLNMDPEDLKRKITPRSKIVMIQHTFGWPAEIEEISEITKKNNLYLIEDCAHSLGAKYSPAQISLKFGRARGEFCGTFGKAAFFSFGRDKIISSVFGGMAVTNDKKIGEEIRRFQEKLDFPSNLWIFQQLLHPILINYLILPLYSLNSNLGGVALRLFHKFSILSKSVYKKEKRGELPKYFPKKLPNVLSVLVLNQFKKLERFNQHRRKIAKFYQENLKGKFKMPLSKESENILPVFMRFPILTEKETDKILERARKKKIYLNDGWRKSPVVPPDTNLKKMKYILGSCPRAERVAKNILNLPTHINISQKEAQKIIDFLNKIL